MERQMHCDICGYQAPTTNEENQVHHLILTAIFGGGIIGMKSTQENNKILCRICAHKLRTQINKTINQFTTNQGETTNG